MLQKSILTILLTFLLAVYMPSFGQKGYEIDVAITGVEEADIILGHYFATQSLYPDDTAHVNNVGKGVFKGNKKLQEGLYFFYLPSGNYFEILIGEDQHFQIETDTSDYVKNLKVKGSEENQLFIDFQGYMMEKQKEMKVLQENLNDSTLSKKEKEKLSDKVVSLLKEKNKKIVELEKEHPNLFVTTFLKATLEVNVPDEIKEDKQKAYEYAKNHYFDNFDLSDVRLLHTPLYQSKMNGYLDNMVLQIPDSLNKEIDMIVEKSRADSALFRYVLITLFNKYAKSQIMGMDAIQVHIAEKYYINEAWWSDEKFLKDLKERVEILKPLLIDQPAPDVKLRVIPAEHFKQAANDTALKSYPHAGNFMNISDVDAEFTVLLFWEATCSHCKKVVPKMYELYQNELKEQGIEVVAVSTLFGEDGKRKWVDFVNKHQLYDWINGWNPYDYEFKVTYDIRSTPQIYVLNKQKQIIGKKLGPENIMELVNAYKKIKEKE